MTTYMVCDDDGDVLVDGLQDATVGDEARITAQSIANKRLETVWLSPSGFDEIAQKIKPAKMTQLLPH